MPDSVALKLGSLRLDVPFFQAPLSGYSDYSMRALARRFGCPFAMADMMLDRAASNPRVLRKACFRPGPDEHPVGAQALAFGHSPGVPKPSPAACRMQSLPEVTPSAPDVARPRLPFGIGSALAWTSVSSHHIRSGRRPPSRPRPAR